MFDEEDDDEEVIRMIQDKQWHAPNPSVRPSVRPSSSILPCIRFILYYFILFYNIYIIHCDILNLNFRLLFSYIKLKVREAFHHLSLGFVVRLFLYFFFFGYFMCRLVAILSTTHLSSTKRGILWFLFTQPEVSILFHTI